MIRSALDGISASEFLEMTSELSDEDLTEDAEEEVTTGVAVVDANSRAKRSARIDAIKPIDDEDYDLLEGSDYDQLEGSGVANEQDLDYGMEDYEEEEVDGMWDDENMVICDNIERKSLF